MSRFLSVTDLRELPPPRWLIQDLFERDSLTMLAGAQASFKSFLALDWSLCMASKRQWAKHVTESAKVLYLLGEGKSNVLKRIEAWETHNRITREEHQDIIDNFRISFEVPQMAVKSDVDRLVRDIEKEDFMPEVVIVDTLARSFVGKDENNQLDSGLWVESADRLRQMGMTVVFLHHIAKNTEFGVKPRGSTAFPGAADTMFTMQRDNDDKTIVKLTCTKQKDHDEGFPLYFRREIVQGSIVLIPINKPHIKTREEKDDDEQRVDTLIADLMASTRFESDRARARELAQRTGKTEEWARSRVRRVKTGSAE